jgi:pyruvate dehydrogenase E1 component alpha subunit
MGHSMADPIHGHYRTKDELEEQKALDPVEHLRRVLVEAGLLGDGEVEAMRAAAEAEVDDAARFAEEAPDPEPGALFTDVYRS